MMKSKATKTLMTLLVACMLLGTNVISVSAYETKDNRVIILNNIEEIERYNGADGIYEVRLGDGSCIKITIKTTNIVNSKTSTYATENIQNKSYKYELRKANGKDLDWSSEVVGKFHFNST